MTAQLVKKLEYENRHLTDNTQRFYEILTVKTITLSLYPNILKKLI